MQERAKAAINVKKLPEEKKMFPGPLRQLWSFGGEIVRVEVQRLQCRPLEECEKLLNAAMIAAKPFYQVVLNNRESQEVSLGSDIGRDCWPSHPCHIS